MRLPQPLQRASMGCRLLILVAIVLLNATWGSGSRALGAGSPGQWLATGSMITARAYHSDILLPNGQVLIVGGVGATGAILSRAELYDPHTARWTRTRDMSVARAGVTAVLLRTGQVLVAGGASGAAGSGPALAS